MADHRAGAEQDERNRLVRDPIAARRSRAAASAGKGEAPILDCEVSPIKGDQTMTIRMGQTRSL
jgi:hypothetical protein